MRFWLSATIVPFLVQTDIRVLHQVIFPQEGLRHRTSVFVPELIRADFY